CLTREAKGDGHSRRQSSCVRPQKLPRLSAAFSKNTPQFRPAPPPRPPETAETHATPRPLARAWNLASVRGTLRRITSVSFAPFQAPSSQVYRPTAETDRGLGP